ncbi:hypothetical protein OI25_616 [Paraburkholderia fungorum]|uniref:Uncharacterized protein n=1 Tax=Paraburkholderia fungorum TaxID=134537 RepID=A0AAU8T579_9BURK|nr:hypothetical protein [Paraburkholderia fungorum]AJZ59034.1 hypothetical protein OI25_616 [Paraburkholderia fungorum]
MQGSPHQQAYVFGNNERLPQKTDSAMIFRSKAKATPAMVDVRQPVAADQNRSDDALPVKQGKPKMLLLDLDPGAVAAVTSKWTDVVIATLGRPYKVPKASGYVPVINHDFLSGHKECDIVVADFAWKQIESRSPGEKHRPNEETDLWVNQKLGYVDNRGLTGLRERETFERIIRQGGIIIVFADYAPPHDAMMTSIGYGNKLVPGSEVNLDVWNLATPFEYLSVSDDRGSVMTACDSSSLGKLLGKYLPESEFRCTFKPRYPDDHWMPLAVNKYQDWVAAALGKDHRLVALVVPQLADKAGFIGELLSAVLPEYLPDLFPEIATGAWTHRSEYELPQVAQLRREKARIEDEARTAVAALDNLIQAEQTANGWLHDLLTATGDELVDAVKRALAEMGFSAVVDVDEIRDKEGLSRREDLRIEDRRPVLVVDIKGIGGRPSDEDATQANKHALIHARETKNPDVQGLSIINHERHMPPLERDNAMPFRDELLTVAEETGLGLMTSFDLYRLIVNMRRWKWAPDTVQPLLYASRRSEIVPAHYEYIGTVAHVWSKAFGVVIENGTVNVGDTLAIEGEIYFEELPVESIRVNDAKVQSATENNQAGFPRAEGGTKLREGARVFVVKRIDHMPTTDIAAPERTGAAAH